MQTSGPANSRQKPEASPVAGASITAPSDVVMLVKPDCRSGAERAAVYMPTACEAVPWG